MDDVQRLTGDIEILVQELYNRHMVFKEDQLREYLFEYACAYIELEGDNPQHNPLAVSFIMKSALETLVEAADSIYQEKGKEYFQLSMRHLDTATARRTAEEDYKASYDTRRIIYDRNSGEFL